MWYKTNEGDLHEDIPYVLSNCNGATLAHFPSTCKTINLKILASVVPQFTRPNPLSKFSMYFKTINLKILDSVVPQFTRPNPLSKFSCLEMCFSYRISNNSKKEKKKTRNRESLLVLN